MKELSNIYKEVGQQFIDDLFKDYLTVTEKLSGSSFSFERDNGQINFYKSNDKPINLIDRTLMVYYENAISYIKKATSGIITTIPDNWRFCFQYFVHNEPGVIQYDNLPKNNLVLTHIQIKSNSGKIGKIIEDPRVINDWANTLNVTPLLPIFKGYLTDLQKQKIRDFISTPKEDHAELFKTNSFASYLIDVLNPSIKSTMLQSDLQKPIDSIVFKFYKTGSTQVFSAKMIDPYTLFLMKDKKLIDLRRVPADINEILLLDILAFIEERGLKKGEILSSTPDERYLELVSNIFNDYVIKRSAGLREIDIEKAEFAKGDEFKLNIDLIPSESTKNTLRNNERMQDLFKIMLGSLRKKRNPEKTGNVLTPSVIADFNLLIDKIEDVVNTEVTSEFKTFGDYLNLKKVNESYENADELVIKEKSLSINEFIHLNKIILNDMKHLKTYDSFFESTLNKKIIKVSLDNKVIGSIDDNDIDAINTIKRITSSSDGKAEVKAFLTTIGIPKDNHEDLITLLGGGDWPKGSSYLLNRTLSVSRLLGKITSSFDVNRTLFGITDKKLSDKLFSFQWATQPPMGKGEAWLALVLENGSKAGVGDVNVNGMNTEVKGVGARLVGQHGYGDAKQMGNHLRNALLTICANLNIDYTPETGSGLDWSVTKRDSRLLGKNLQEMSKIKGGFSKTDIQLISSSLIDAYKNLYTGLQTTKYKNILIPLIKKDGSLDANGYNITTLKMSFDYYHQVEQFVYFAMTNNKTGNFLIIEPKDFDSLVDSGAIKYSPQSWGERSGTQGGYFAIEIK